MKKSLLHSTNLMEIDILLNIFTTKNDYKQFEAFDVDSEDEERRS